MKLIPRRKKLKISLNGGLGNQMFQYSFGRSLSLQLDCDLSLDLSAFKSDTYYKRTYELGVFNLSKGTSTCSNKFLSLISWNLNKLARRNIFSNKFFRNIFIIEGDADDYLDRFIKISSPGYAAGYWQNENYFIKYKKIIKDDFKIFVELSDSTKVMSNIINSSKNPVSIHVRRNHEKPSGDISENKNSKITTTLDYYNNAIEEISKKLDTPNFFIFSDNLGWAKANLSFISNATFVNSSDRPGFEDLYLMTQCHHHIIANSSFSWWGAWLSINQSGQIVIAPKNVIYTPPIPDDWIAL